MIAIAINNRAASYLLMQHASEFVLSVPGPSLLREAMYCGVESFKDCDKVRDLSLEFMESETVSVPGLKSAIANVELRKHSSLEVGDHMLVVGEVKRFSVNQELDESPLLSVGPDTRGYRVLLKKGIHRLAVVDRDR
jgi:flavin reductase (DIM6/NTAB) family NADH-FMN oxidoreductase RutF